MVGTWVNKGFHYHTLQVYEKARFYFIFTMKLAVMLHFFLLIEDKLKSLSDP